MRSLIRKILETARKVPFLVKLILLFVYPIGTTAVLAYYFVDSVLYKAHLNYEIDYNMSEETVKKYADYILSKHFTLHNNTPGSWNKKRELWKRVNQNSEITAETKKKFLAAMKKINVFINNDEIIDNYAYNHMQDEMNRQFNEQAMEEGRKSVTPFDHGGYVQGDGFNPSDTMAADAQRQMDSMNHMNNMNNM